MKSSPPAVKADKLLAGVVLVVVVVAGLIYGLPRLSRSKPKPQPAAVALAPAVPVSKPAPAPTAPQPVDSPIPAAGQPLTSAHDIVVAHEKQGNEVATILEGTTPSAAAKTPDSATPATPPKPLAPVVPVEPPPPPPPPPPNEAFRQFVVNLRVNGIFQGENARAMLNNKMVFPGDVVNTKLAITLLKIDVDTKQLIFRDETGATVTRRF